MATLLLCYCCCFTVLSFTCHLSFLFVKNKNYNLLTFYYPVIKKTFLSSNKTIFHIVILWSSQFMMWTNRVHTGWGCSVLCVGPPGMLQLLVLWCPGSWGYSAWGLGGTWILLVSEMWTLSVLLGEWHTSYGRSGRLFQLAEVTADTGWARGASARWLLSAICKHCRAGASTLWSEGSTVCVLAPGFLTVLEGL